MLSWQEYDLNKDLRDLWFETPYDMTDQSEAFIWSMWKLIRIQISFDNTTHWEGIASHNKNVIIDKYIVVSEQENGFE